MVSITKDYIHYSFLQVDPMILIQMFKMTLKNHLHWLLSSGFHDLHYQSLESSLTSKPSLSRGCSHIMQDELASTVVMGAFLDLQRRNFMQHQTRNFCPTKFHPSKTQHERLNRSLLYSLEKALLCLISCDLFLFCCGPTFVHFPLLFDACSK